MGAIVIAVVMVRIIIVAAAAVAAMADHSTIHGRPQHYSLPTTALFTAAAAATTAAVVAAVVVGRGSRDSTAARTRLSRQTRKRCAGHN